MENCMMSIPNGFYIGNLEIRFYGIISALSYLLGVVVTCFNAKRRGMKTDDIIVLACYVIPLAIVGARLYYVLFSLEKYTNFWDIFKIWEGGLALYGGLIGGALGVLLFSIIHKKNVFAVADIVMPSMILAQSLGRWGNFFNQEAYGYAVTNPSLQWFPFSVYIDGSGWHLATFFYESLWNFVSFIILESVLWKVDFKRNGVITAGYFVLYGAGRAWIEGLRTDSLYIGNSSLRVSQLLSIIFVIGGLAYWAYYFFFLRKKSTEKDFDIIMNVLKNDP